MEEPKEAYEGLFVGGKKSFRPLTVALFGISVAGLALQTVTVFHPVFRQEMGFAAAAWAVGCLLIAVWKPASTPKALLVLYLSILVTQTIALVDGSAGLHPKDVVDELAIIAALGAVAVILLMPLRDPSLLGHKISPAFAAPTSDLRSPEDNLTLWQFMTVSWMAPLISLGNARQLNDEDVWQLGFEFQHRMLHDTFRDLKGTVLVRLLRANGVDLVIISILSIIELFASMFPALLSVSH